MSSQYPVKLMSPTPLPSAKSLVIHVLSYGGGLVQGDNVTVRGTVSKSSTVAMTTQGFTKVFVGGRGSKQRLEIKVQNGGICALLPDPVQCFRGSSYVQDQVFEVEVGGSLCVLDWVCDGRTGESWEFESFLSRNEVWEVQPEPVTNGHAKNGVATTNVETDEKVHAPRRRLVIKDNVRLDGAVQQRMLSPHAPHRLYTTLATLILHGPAFETLSTALLARFRHEKVNVQETSLWTVAKTARGATVVKVASEGGVEECRRVIWGLVGEELEDLVGREGVRALVE
ncbi:hypothetical protein YB2330_004479 [Saitoella coloradoensis]